MPSRSRAQQKFMMAELSRKKKGKKTKTDMSEAQLMDFKKLAPKKKKKKKS